MADIRARTALLVTAVLAVGCSDDAAGGNDTSASETGMTQGPGPTTTGSAATENSTTADAVDTTASSEASSDNASGDGSTTRRPTVDGRIRLLLGEGGRLGAGFETLSVLDYDAGSVTKTAVHDPLPAGRIVAFSGISPAKTLVYFRTRDTSKADNDRGFVAAYADGETEDPVQINVAPSPVPGLGGTPEFTDDDTSLFFFARGGASGTDPGIWVIDDLSGTFGPPVLVHPPLGAGDDVNSDIVVGPGAVGMAFTGDFSGSDLNNVYLASSQFAAVGAVLPLSLHDDPAQTVAFVSIRWAPDGSALMYRADTETDGVNEVWWVGLAGEVPTVPIKINNPLATDETITALRVAPDSRTVAYWSGDATSGEVSISYIDGDAPSAPMVVSTPTAGAAFPNSLRFSPSGDGLIYTAEHDTPGNRDAYYVELSGALPASPERINGELLPGAAVMSVVFGPDANFLYYVAPQNQAGGELFRAELLGGVPAAPERLSGELTDGGGLSGEIIFSPVGDALLYTAFQDSTSRQELYLVPLGDEPGPSVKVNDTLGQGVEVQFTARFSADGSVVAYRTRERMADVTPLLIDDLSDGPGNPIVLIDVVQGYKVLPTP
ncbi:MAG: hypothetical protein JKY37_13090 [Nannocystaceae bacterium]|nr:hypothetical protein [Nannocystaceae bacterium]